MPYTAPTFNDLGENVTSRNGGGCGCLVDLALRGHCIRVIMIAVLDHERSVLTVVLQQAL